MRNSNNASGSCHACSKPKPQCECVPKKMANVQVPEWDCDGLYHEGKCVGITHCSGVLYFRSVRDNNTGNKPGSEDGVWWDGPHLDICGLMSSLDIKGDKGDTGASGPKGDKGDKGDTGDAGADGARGDEGQRGDTGPRGIEGDTGPAGLQGIRGIQGVDGEQGEDGNTGAAGSQGQQGQQGERGVQGLVGPAGIQGIQGIQGVKGDDGLPYSPDSIVDVLPTGFSCPDCSDCITSTLEATTGLLYFCINGELQPGIPFGKGDKGDTGEQGATGPQGPRGLDGGIGPKGDQGVPGPQGPNGVRGEQGVQGVDGAQGVDGPQGQPGPRGLKGDEGQRGDAGPRGERGLIGPKGDKGDTGERGDQGPKGDPGGPQGPKGDQGATPVIGENGNWWIANEDTGIPAVGPKGEPGKDYDPNCQAPVVVEIQCADRNGNLTLVFEDDEGKKDYHGMPAAVFRPTNIEILAAVEHVDEVTQDKTWVTTNRIESTITWSTRPTVGMQFILSDFKPGAMVDFNKQAITFDVLDMNGGCLGTGYWAITVECNNCNCIIPSLTVEDNGPNGKCAVWNDGKGGVVKLALCDSDCGIVDPHPNHDPLLARKWEDDCEKGVCPGYYTYNNAYWLNVNNGNKAQPASKDGWSGPFDAFELVQAHMEHVLYKGGE